VNFLRPEEAGTDFLCAPAPGNGYILNSFSFTFFKVSGADRLEGQKSLPAKSCLRIQGIQSDEINRRALMCRWISSIPAGEIMMSAAAIKANFPAWRMNGHSRTIHGGFLMLPISSTAT
jgi:hypothetical protein